VVNWCESNPEDCLACDADVDCAYGGNPCTETVYCAHVEQSIAVIQIGCDAALEHPWPPDPTCHCVEGACRADE